MSYENSLERHYLRHPELRPYPAKVDDRIIYTDHAGVETHGRIAIVGPETGGYAIAFDGKPGILVFHKDQTHVRAEKPEPTKAEAALDLMTSRNVALMAERDGLKTALDEIYAALIGESVPLGMLERQMRDQQRWTALRIIRTYREAAKQ